MPRIWIGRIVILLVALICLVFTVTAIKDNPLLLKDLGQAIQSTQLELSITAFLVVLLAGLSLEINHRNQPQKDPGHGWRRCNPKGEVNTLWEGISTELHWRGHLNNFARYGGLDFSTICVYSES